MGSDYFSDLSADNLLQIVKSSYLDNDYLHDKHWKLTKTKFNSRVDDSEYTFKKKLLEAKGHPVDEMFVYLLFSNNQINKSSAFVHPSCSFMHLNKHKPWSPTENLGSFDNGIVFFKSVDPLLKFAKIHKLTIPKIIVYKILIGKKKSQVCTLQNVGSERSKLELEFDSCDIELDSNVKLQYLDLNIQLRFSEIFLHDFKSVERNGIMIDVVTACPRQVLPVALLSFRGGGDSTRKPDVVKSRKSTLRSRGKIFPSFYRHLSCCKCCENTPRLKRTKSPPRRSKKKDATKASKEEVGPQVTIIQSSSDLQTALESSPSTSAGLCSDKATDGCAFVAQEVPLSTNGAQGSTNCGDCIDNLLSGLTDQSLLELCKDAGLLSSSTQNFPDLGLNPLGADPHALATTEPRKMDARPENTLVTDSEPCPQQPEDTNLSLLDDLCKLIDDVTPSNFSPVSSQWRSMTSQTLATTTSGYGLATSVSSPQQCNGIQLLPVFSNSSSQTTLPPNVSYGENSLFPTLCLDRSRVFGLKALQKIVSPRPSKRQKKASSRKVGKVIRRVKEEIKAGFPKSRKKSVAENVVEAKKSEVECLNKSYFDIRRQREQKEKLYRFYEPRQNAAIRYISSPVRQISSRNSIAGSNRLNLKRKSNASTKTKARLSSQQSVFCEVVSIDLATRATRMVNCEKSSSVDEMKYSPPKPKRRAVVQLTPLKYPPNLVPNRLTSLKNSPDLVGNPAKYSPDLAAENDPAFIPLNVLNVPSPYQPSLTPPCGCSSAPKSQMLPPIYHKGQPVRFAPYSFCYRVMPCVHFTHYPDGRMAASSSPNTTFMGPFVAFQNDPLNCLNHHPFC